MTNNQTLKRLFEANKAVFPLIVFGHETQFFLAIEKTKPIDWLIEVLLVLRERLVKVYTETTNFLAMERMLVDHLIRQYFAFFFNFF
jgi:hypothetical protein